MQALGSTLTFPNGGSVTGMAKGDFNGNGKLDLAATQSTNVSGVGGRGFISILLGKGDDTFATPTATDTVQPPQGQLQAGDLNGDGRLDLVVVNTSNSVSALMGKGDGTFGAQTTSGTLGSAGPLYVGNMNRDGIPDVVTGGNGGGLSVLRGKGDGTLVPAQTFAIGAIGAQTVTVADLNGDGLLDIIVGHPGANKNALTVLIQEA